AIEQDGFGHIIEVFDRVVAKSTQAIEGLEAVLLCQATIPDTGHEHASSEWLSSEREHEIALCHRALITARCDLDTGIAWIERYVRETPWLVPRSRPWHRHEARVTPRFDLALLQVSEEVDVGIVWRGMECQ